MIDPSTLTIASAARALRQRQLTSRTLTDACLARIEAQDGALNAFITITPTLAREQADRADRELADGFDRGPLHGIPLSIKDLIDIDGFPTTAASRVRDGLIARRDAPIISALRRAGAVFVGKTNLHEFALGTTGEESAYGPTCHPLDDTRSPGGSSSGSAASLLAGMCLASIGTDTGGSIRMPSAACGLVGLKPTIDEVSADGVVPLSRAFDCIGPLAKTTDDAWAVYDVLIGRTPASLITPRPIEAPRRVGLVGGYFASPLADPVAEAYADVVHAVRETDVRVDDVTLSEASLAPSIYVVMVIGEAAALHARTLERVPDAYTRGIRLRLEMGRYILGEDVVRAERARRRLRAQVDAALSTHDVLVMPTMPIVAPLLGASTVRVGESDVPVRSAMLRNTQPFNITGHPALTLPAPSPGLPVGVQIVGKRTDAVLRAGRWLERVLGR